jgi:hypothetical protein
MTVLVLPLIFVFIALTVLVFAVGARRLLGLRFSFLRTLIAGVLAFLIASPIITAISGSVSAKRTSVLPVGHPLGYSRFSGTARVCPQGRAKRAHAVPGGSGVGLCLPGRGDNLRSDPPISEGGPGVRAAPRNKADGFTSGSRRPR